MQPVCGCTTMLSVGLHGLAWRSPGCLASTFENKENRDTSQISERSFVVNRKELDLHINMHKL
jgi:hypothetical protein